MQQSSFSFRTLCPHAAVCRPRWETSDSPIVNPMLYWEIWYIVYLQRMRHNLLSLFQNLFHLRFVKILSYRLRYLIPRGKYCVLLFKCCLILQHNNQHIYNHIIY